MLGIGVLGASRAGYYLDTVASGREDYYLGSGEAPGVWLGHNSASLGLAGRVASEDLHAVLEGLAPDSGVRLDRARSNRTPGFDLTFSAPKSVSIMFALADDDVSAQVRAAHDRSVVAALRWLEHNACVVRRGAGGAVSAAGDGFVAAAFRHRTSRAGDPHLHTHVLVANVTRGPDGRWTALDARHLFALSKTAGHLYEAQLRHELTARLGLEWGPVRNGIADLAGIPRALIENLSQRRQQITDRLDELGLSSARAAQIAVLDTRTTKNPAVEVDELRVDWREIAADHGIDGAAIGRLVDRVQVMPITATAAQQVTAALVGPDGLTAHASTFDRRHVLQAWCNQLAHGAPIVDVERFAAATLTVAEVVQLRGESASVAMRRRDRRRMEAPALGARYSTAELLMLEEQLVVNALRRAGETTATVDGDSVERSLGARPFLAYEQREMVRTLATSGRGVDVVIAPAGSGKTTALAAAGETWTRAGYHVIGCAVAAKAARQLETTAGIRSTTIAALREDLATGARFGPRTVLIIDEAGMAGTRTVAPLLSAAHIAHAKVVLVGDTKQLPEIDAGGLLRGLDHRLGGVHLHHNRRQRNEWERLALAQLRDGRLPEALSAYQSHDRFTVTSTAAAARDRTAAEYARAHVRGEHAVMLAMRWRDVHDLNRLARARLAEVGLLSGPILNIEGRPYQRGDRVLTLKNARRLGIVNGTTGTVTLVDTNARTLTVRTDEDSTVTLPATYIDAGAVVHGYATTVHKAQGITVDRAFVYADDQLARESGYTAFSRGALENRVYLVGAPRIEHDHGHLHTPDPLDRLGRSLERSEAQHLAIDHDVGIEID